MMTADETMQKIKELVLQAKAERDQLKAELKLCRNELCLFCGKYKNAHNGACDGCRWKSGVWND